MRKALIVSALLVAATLPIVLALESYYLRPIGLQRQVLGYSVTPFGTWPDYERGGSGFKLEQEAWRYELSEEICRNLRRDYGCMPTRSGFGGFRCIARYRPNLCYLARAGRAAGSAVAIIADNELVIVR